MRMSRVERAGRVLALARKDEVWFVDDLSRMRWRIPLRCALLMVKMRGQASSVMRMRCAARNIGRVSLWACLQDCSNERRLLSGGCRLLILLKCFGLSEAALLSVRTPLEGHSITSAYMAFRSSAGRSKKVVGFIAMIPGRSSRLEMSWDKRSNTTRSTRHI